MTSRTISPDPKATVAGASYTGDKWSYAMRGLKRELAQQEADAVPDAVDKESLDHYVGLYSEAGALRAFLTYYQNFWVHSEQTKAHIEAGKLAMPVLVYGGDGSQGELTKQCMEELAADVSGGVIPNCGHWIAEENPEFVLAALRDFLDA